MKILLATSEAVPFAKTGGLADVCGALPGELAALGHEVTLIMPAYRQIYQAALPIQPTDIELQVPVGQKMVAGRLLRGQLPGSEKTNNPVSVYFVEQAQYFDRDHIYGSNSQDYRDNCERGSSFSVAG